MARTLEVLIRHRPLQLFDGEAMLDTVREVYRRNGVAIELRLGSVAPLMARQMGGVSVNGCTFAVFGHLEMFSHVQMAPRGQVVVFVVERITDPGSGLYAGCAAHPELTPGLVITEAAARGGPASSASGGRWVLAHELTHVLGVPAHDYDVTKLMHTSATAISASMPSIDSDQRTAVNGSRYLGPGRPSPAREVGERSTPERSTPSHWDRPRSYFVRSLP